jgi:hypothetical protein
MTEDQFSEAFATYYTDNVEIYGDSDQGLEEAYNDFIQTEDTLDQQVSDEVDAFSEFYSELEDVYGDSDEGIEEAYADFTELLAAEGQVEEDEFSEEDEAFMEFYSEVADIYGDSDEGLEEAYADFYSALNEGQELEDDIYSDDTYSDEDLLEEFADFYADTEDIYGDDIESAFDDYADALETIAEEDAYASEGESSLSKEVLTDAGKGALVGAGVGAALGVGMGFFRKWLDKRSVAKLPATIATLEKKIAEGEAQGKSTIFKGVKLAEAKKALDMAKNRQRNPKGALVKSALKGAGRGAISGGTLGAVRGYGNHVIKNYSMADTAKAVAPEVTGAVGGGMAGVAAGHAATYKWRAELKALKAKKRPTQEDEARISSLKKKIVIAKLGGAVVVGSAGAVAGTKFKDTDNSDVYAEEGESKFGKMKSIFTDKARKAGSMAKKNPIATGAGAGALIGLAAGAVTDKSTAERKALKAKVKAGNASQAEIAKLAEMKKARRNRLMKATAVGGATGAAAGAIYKNKDAIKGKFTKKTPESKEEAPAKDTEKSYLIENSNDRSYADLSGEGTTRELAQKNRRDGSDVGTYISGLIKK